MSNSYVFRIATPVVKHGECRKNSDEKVSQTLRTFAVRISSLIRSRSTSNPLLILNVFPIIERMATAKIYGVKHITIIAPCFLKAHSPIAASIDMSDNTQLA